MQTSDFIAIGSVLVASLSALYARWSVQTARRQNEISLHSERLRVYRGVVDFGVKLAAKGPAINEKDIWAFDEWVQLSEFYFNKEIYDRLEKIFQDSMKLLDKNDEWNVMERSSEEAKKINGARHKTHRALRDECFSIRDAMKSDLRVA